MSDATRHMLGFDTIEELRNACGLPAVENDVLTAGVSAATVIGSVIDSIKLGLLAHPDRTAASVPAVLGWTLNHLADTRQDMPLVAMAQELIAAHTARGVPIVPIAELLPLLERIHAAAGPSKLPDHSLTYCGVVHREHPQPPCPDGGEPNAPDGTLSTHGQAEPASVPHARHPRMRTTTGLSIRLTAATLEVGRLLLDAPQPLSSAQVARQLGRAPGTVETALHRLGILGWITVTTAYKRTVGKTSYFALNRLGRTNVSMLSGTSAAVALWQELGFPDALTAVGARIQTMRVSRGWSQLELANRTDMDRAEISRIEAGKKNITLELLRRLANALRVHWADLLDDRRTEVTARHQTSRSFTQQLAAVGIRVYQIRVLQRLYQQTLADQTGLARSHIFDIEAGAQNMTLRTLYRLAAGLGVHWADLLDNDEQHHPAGQHLTHAFPNPPTATA